MYAHLMGVPDTKPRVLPHWPSDNTPRERDPGSQRELLRFRWESPWDHTDNWAGIRLICDHIKQNGPTRVPEAAQAVRDVSEKDLEDRVRKKFKDLAKVLKEYEEQKQAMPAVVEGQEIAVVVEGQEVESRELDVPVPEKAKGATKSQLQSRSKGVRCSRDANKHIC